jgi:hypothetical protein
MLFQGKAYPGATLNIAGNFTDTDGFAVDPAVVRFRLMDPDGTETTFIYPTNITRSAIGKYSVATTPNMGGRWFYRWEISAGTTTLTPEGEFVIQSSPFIDGRRDAYRA